MFERLLFPSFIEQEACSQLLRDNWPSVTIVNIGDKEQFALEIHLNVDEAAFFRWVYLVSQNPGTRVLPYCYRYSVMLSGDNADRPAWMHAVLVELRTMKLLLGESDV